MELSRKFYFQSVGKRGKATLQKAFTSNFTDLGGILKISKLYQNRVVKFLCRETGTPIFRTMDWCTRHVGLSVILLLLIGMGLRIGYRGMVERPERDEIFYISAVEDQMDSYNQNLQRPAGMLVYVGYTMTRLGCDAELGMRSVNLFCSFLWLWLMYLLGRAAFSSDKLGLICLTLAVFNPYTIRLSGQVMREPMYLLFFTCGLFCAIQIVRGVAIIRHAALLGPLIVLGVWSRDEGIEMLMLAPLAVFFRGMYLLHSKQLKQLYPLVLGFLSYLLMLGVIIVGGYLFFPGRLLYLLQRIITGG